MFCKIIKRYNTNTIAFEHIGYLGYILAGFILNRISQESICICCVVYNVTQYLDRPMGLCLCDHTERFGCLSLHWHYMLQTTSQRSMNLCSPGGCNSFIHQGFYGKDTNRSCPSQQRDTQQPCTSFYLQVFIIVHWLICFVLFLFCGISFLHNKVKC